MKYVKCLCVCKLSAQDIWNNKKENQRLYHKKWTQKTCLKQITLSKSKSILLNHPVQWQQNKWIAGNIHSTQKTKMQTTKHYWKRFVCQLELKFVQLFMVFILIHFFFTAKLAVQTAQLRNSQTAQHWGTVVAYTLLGAYFEPCFYNWDFSIIAIYHFQYYLFPSGCFCLSDNFFW